MLSEVKLTSVGTGVLDGPQESKEILVELTEYGKIADKYIKQLNDFYENISIDDYVIMPNHIHLLINIHDNGPSRTPVPTELVCVENSMQNSVISGFISTLKRFSNKEIGKKSADSVFQPTKRKNTPKRRGNWRFTQLTDQHSKATAKGEVNK